MPFAFLNLRLSAHNHLPAYRRLRYAGLWLVALCMVSPAAYAASKVEKSKEALSSIHEKIESLKEALNNATEAHADATDALKESEKSISETNRTLYELNQQYQDRQARLEDLQSQKSGIQETLNTQKTLLSAQLYQQYLHGQQTYLHAMLQQQSPSAIARNVQYYSYIAKARAKLIASMQDNLTTVAKLNDDTAKSLAAIHELKIVQENERKTLQKQKTEHAKVLKKLSAQINQQRGEIEKLKRDEKSLSDLVEKLTKASPVRVTNTKKPKKEESVSDTKPSPDTTQPPEKNTPPAEKTVIAHNDTLPDNDFDGANFAALKGKLNLPVKGEVVNRFGAQREDTSVSWKGLFIKSAEGSEVRSVASGKVVFADWMRGFGNLLIIDHGDGYMSLYGNNQALFRKVGERVKGGDPIASVGNSGGNDTNGLYYELRKQSKPFDPLSWSIVR